MRARIGVIYGSIVGALAIHAAFMACGSMQSMQGGDSGMSHFLEAVKDAAADVVGLETRDAHADDAATGPACSCLVPPAPAEATFSLRIDLGNGPVEPMTDYSQVTITGSARPYRDRSNVVMSQIKATAIFTPAGRNVDYTLDCSFRIAPDRSILPTDVDCKCEGIGLNNSLELSGVTVPVLTETTAEIRIASAAGRFGATISQIAFRVNDPAAHFLTPPHQYRSSL